MTYDNRSQNNCNVQLLLPSGGNKLCEKLNTFRYFWYLWKLWPLWNIAMKCRFFFFYFLLHFLFAIKAFKTNYDTYVNQNIINFVNKIQYNE